MNLVKFKRDPALPRLLEAIIPKETFKSSIHYSLKRNDWVFSLGVGISDKGYKTSELLEENIDPYSTKNNPIKYYVPFIYKTTDYFLDVPLSVEKSWKIGKISLGICAGFETSTLLIHKSVLDYGYKKSVTKSLELFEERQVTAILKTPLTILPEKKFSIQLSPLITHTLFRIGENYFAHNIFWGLETSLRFETNNCFE